jgi:hypothetical protein
MRSLCLIVTLSSLAAVGCSATTSSRNIRTAGMVAQIDVTSQSAGQSTVDVDLVIGGSSSNTYVVLEGGDTFKATAGGEAKVMQATSDGEYEAKFPVSEGEFVVSLERDEDDPAPASKGVLPPPFEITSDFGADPISRTEPITLTWTPANTDATVLIELEGDCIISERFKVGGDPGTFTIAADEYKAWKSKKDETCNVVATITRTTQGVTDPALDSDSHFRLHQVRTTRFVSGP